MTQEDQDQAGVRPSRAQRVSFIAGYWLLFAVLPCLFGWPGFQRFLAHREDVRRQEIVRTAEQFAQNAWQGEGSMDIYAESVNNPVSSTLRFEGARGARVTLLIDKAGPANASKESVTVEMSLDVSGQWQGVSLQKSPVPA
jgi:hypothetical protein